MKRFINAIPIENATKIDYFITNVEPLKVIPEWIVNSYSLQKLDRGFLSRSAHDG
ncbi:MAG: hypothetical protein O4860_04720 [Trichodesmium sp. St2_bin2_1]|nr:hypothetical protein [Trichodesmium sp. St2_bin2_1]